MTLEMRRRWDVGKFLSITDCLLSDLEPGKLLRHGLAGGASRLASVASVQPVDFQLSNPVRPNGRLCRNVGQLPDSNLIDTMIPYEDMGIN